MRAFSTALIVILINTTSAQTVNTVQNGDWNSPSTWSCNCVPAAGNSLVILHSVTLTNDLVFAFPQTQVTSTGEITTPFPVNVILGGVFIMEGHVFIAGTVNNAGGTLDIVGFFEVAGNFSSDGDLIMDGGILQVEGNFTNYLAVSGEGSICVVDITSNQGTITGTVDICDATPTTTTAPIVDDNSGTIAPTVTYCSNSACMTGIDDAVLARLTVQQDVAGERLIVSQIPAGSTLAIIDASGRTCIIRSGSADRMVIDSSPLAGGLYHVVVRSAGAVRTMPLVIVR